MNGDQPIRTRREFLRNSLYLMGLSATVPAFLSHMATQTVFGQEEPEVPSEKTKPNTKGKGDERILVVVQLAGGNDGLNTIVPHRLDPYYKERPKLAIPKTELLKINDDYGFHPGAKDFKELFDGGLMAAVHGVGYPNPNRSHFVATDIWETASPDKRHKNGWLGRYFDSQCKGSAENNRKPGPEDAIALLREAPLSLHGDEFQAVAFARPHELTWHGNQDPALAKEFKKFNQPPKNQPAKANDNQTLDFLRRISFNAQISADKIKRAARKDTGVTYPRSGLAGSMKIVARLIAGKMPTRVYYVSIGGFDTHATQPDRHRNLLTELSGAIRAFLQDMKKQGNLDRVLVMTFSEFGRRVAENGSAGTDHGTAAPMFLFGSKIKPGLHGTHPSLDKLDQGDLIHTLDFRRIYADVLGKWLAADANSILGKGIKPFELIKA